MTIAGLYLNSRGQLKKVDRCEMFERSTILLPRYVIVFFRYYFGSFGRIFHKENSSSCLSNYTRKSLGYNPGPGVWKGLTNVSNTYVTILQMRYYLDIWTLARTTWFLSTLNGPYRSLRKQFRTFWAINAHECPYYVH